jgi:hypothetical protein
MTIPEPTSIDASVSEKAGVLGVCGAGGSSEALRSQVDHATDHLGQILPPEQLTFIKDRVALLLDGDPLLAQFASRMRSTSVASLQKAAGSFCEVYPHLCEAAGSFCEVYPHLSEAAGSFCEVHTHSQARGSLPLASVPPLVKSSVEPPTKGLTLAESSGEPPTTVHYS